jgi:hypothetical protein
MVYGLKFQFLGGGNCYSSSVWLRIIMEKEDTFGQKSAMMLQIVGISFSSSLVLYHTLLIASPFYSQGSRIGPFISENNVIMSFPV